MDVQLLHEDAQMPVKAHADDAGFDIHCVSKFSLESYELSLVSTGIAARAPLNSYLHIALCSGLASKGSTFSTTVEVLGGVVDQNYIGEIKVLLFNSSHANIAIATGDRIAQVILMMIAHPQLVQVDKFSNTDYRTGGFGSSGMGRT
ncbi:dUTPase-like protein, partial [Coemansia reversa NRRL 1564]